MPSFSSGYQADKIALINELEAKLKKIIVFDIDNNINIKETDKKVEALIKEFADNIPDDYEEKPNMIRAARYTKRVLYNNYKRTIESAYQKAKDQLGEILGVKVGSRAELMALLLTNLDKIDATRVTDAAGTSTISFQRGTPYIADYYRRVRITLNDLVDQAMVEPPKLLKRGLSLRSLAELNIRHNFHKEEIKQYTDSGTKLVWISTHADCSERCQPYQGNLYSLDGTSGTIEGKTYKPLETATQIPYKTKAGRTYMNGLFGFNCRHRMIAYQPGSRPPMDYTAEEIRKEREITNKQRGLERIIFKTRLEAEITGLTDTIRSRQLKRRASMLFATYEAFSHKNKHAYYPERCSIPKNMREYIREKGK